MPSGGYVPLPTSPNARPRPSDELAEGNGGVDVDVDVDVDFDVDEGEVVVPGEDNINAFVWILVLSAAISGLLFGYDTGYVSAVLVSIGTDLGKTLSNADKQAITSSTTLGALIGGLIAGGLSDYTGRRGVMALANVVFIAGAWVQAAAHAVRPMVLGRFVVGLGVGLASCVAPLYIGELAPTKLRGRLVTINCVLITLGQVVAYAIGAAFADALGGWRWMVGLAALPAATQLIALIFLPESPRILLLRGEVAQVERVLARVYPQASPADVGRKVAIMAASVKQSAAIEASTTFMQRFRSLLTNGNHRRALIVGCALQFLQQACGFNSLMYYSATLLSLLGFKNATGTAMLIALINFAFTLVALKIVDPVGRRRTMLFTVPIMILGLVMASFFFSILTKETHGILLPDPPQPYSPTISALVLLSMLIFVAAYATGSGNIPWQQGELFRLEVRGIGTSLCTATNWSCNLIVSATFLSLLESATAAGAFLIYAFFCFLGWVFCYFCYPETSGLSLEQVFHVFDHGFGVEKSKAMRAAARVRAGARDHGA